MSYFLQRADIQGNRSLSLLETLVCCHFEKKGCMKAEESFQIKLEMNATSKSLRNAQPVVPEHAGRLSEL